MGNTADRRYEVWGGGALNDLLKGGVTERYKSLGYGFLALVAGWRLVSANKPVMSTALAHAWEVCVWGGCGRG